MAPPLTDAQRRQIEALVPWLWRVARRVGRRLGVEAGELLSDGAMALPAALERYDPACGVTLTTWLSPHVTGAMFDGWRRDRGGRRRRRPERLSELDESALTARDDPAAEAERADRMAWMLAALADRPREHLTARLWLEAGLSAGEIARSLGLSERATAYRLARIRRVVSERAV